MTDRPIIFSAPMVRALLDGRKTQTRRVLKRHYGTMEWLGGQNWRPICTKFFPGDRLWVRETFRGARGYDGTSPARWGNKPIWYAADGEPGDNWGFLSDRNRSPIHMPRWASRLTLHVTNVRVQRLQEISEADAVAEGASMRLKCSGFLGRHPGWSMDWSRVGEMSAYARREPGGPAKAPLTETDISLGDARMAFASYWNDIHGPDAWDANPWCAAISFEVERANIEASRLRAERKG